mgnify:CR=1 FL=1
MSRFTFQNHDWTESYKLEARFRYILSEQETYGWKMDVNKMKENQKDLEEKLLQLHNEIRELAPKKVTNQKEIKKPLKADGTASTVLINWYNTLDIRMFRLDQIAGPFTRVQIEKINPNSSTQRIQALLKVNWQPTEWNYKKDRYGKVIFIDRIPTKTSPKLTEDSVMRCELGKLMVKYTQMLHRSSLVRGLIEKLRDNETLGGGANTVGANTGRCLHRVIANIPRKSSFYGEEIRSMFSCREGYILLGADLSALENKLIGHYTYPIDNGVYAKRLIEEDPHNKTMELFRQGQGIIMDRDVAKTVNYALGFGAGIEKLKNVLNCNQITAKRLHKIWWDDKKPITKLKEILQSALINRVPMYIKGLDGRKVFVRNKKDVVNTLIQSAGSIVNKHITVAVNRQIKEQKLDAHLVLNYHDEINYEIREKELDIIKQIIYTSIEEVNERFKFRVPMDMDIHIGNNWKEIH